MENLTPVICLEVFHDAGWAAHFIFDSNLAIYLWSTTELEGVATSL